MKKICAIAVEHPVDDADVDPASAVCTLIGTRAALAEGSEDKCFVDTRILGIGMFHGLKQELTLRQGWPQLHFLAVSACRAV